MTSSIMIEGKDQWLQGYNVIGECPPRYATGGWIWDVEKRTAGGNWNED